MLDLIPDSGQDDGREAAPQPYDRSRARPRPPLVPHLVHIFPSFGVGGAQVRFTTLVKALGDQFWHTVVPLRDDIQAASLLTEDAPVAFAEPPTAAGGPLRRLLAGRALLKRLNPDLLLTYNWGAMEIALANHGRIAHLHMEDGFGPEEAVRQFPRRVWARRVALARSEVVVPSLTLQRIAVGVWRLPSRRVRYIPNGVGPQATVSTPLESLAPDLPPDLPKIVWAGALRPEKNLPRLLRAFAPLKEQAALLLIGDGPERDAVLREAARLELGPRLRLLGQRTDVRDLVMQCQVLALSSDTEQMPMVVLEAMAAALPVAACNVGDVRHMVAPENHPFIGPPTEEALATALRTLIADADLRTTVGQANRARQRQLFSEAQMVDAYRRLLLRRTSAAA